MIIFISSYPRSGTTYLAKTCVSDLGFYSTPESHFIHELISALDTSIDKKLNRQSIIKILSKSFKFRSWGIEIPDFDYLDFNNIVDFYYELVGMYNSCSVEEVKLGVVIDHTPENTLNLNLLRKYFPSSVFLFLVRDPRSLFNSIAPLRWGPNTSLYFCKHYLKYIKIIQKQIRIQQDSILLYFEQFISDREQFYSELKLVLPNYHVNEIRRFSLPEYTKSQHKLVDSDSSNQNRIDAWKVELNSNDAKYIENNLSKYDLPILDIYNLRANSGSFALLFPTILIEYLYKIRNKLSRYLLEKKI